jgi:ubiquinone/menaquinone biosynthesis C-methylase UbiE
MSQNPLSNSEPWNLVADGYAETTMLVFEQFADEAIVASKLKPDSTALDVACGPGTATSSCTAATRKPPIELTLDAWLGAGVK